MNVHNVATWEAVLLQFVAAALWLKSTTVRASAKKLADAEEAKSGWRPAQIVLDDDTDFTATAQLQTYWNKWAALATALGVAFQAVSTATGR